MTRCRVPWRQMAVLNEYCCETIDERSCHTNWIEGSGEKHRLEINKNLKDPFLYLFFLAKKLRHPSRDNFHTTNSASISIS